MVCRLNHQTLEVCLEAKKVENHCCNLYVMTLHVTVT